MDSPVALSSPMLEGRTPGAALPSPLRRRQPAARQAPPKGRRPQRILVPVDGSGNSLRALEYVARRLRSDHRPFLLTVLNVQPRVPRGRRVTRTMVEEHYARQSEAALGPAHRFLARRKLPADVRMLIGDPAPTIVDFAQRLRCSEIVMGTRGLGSLKGLLLGSVTTKVIHLAKMPVTAVP